MYYVFDRSFFVILGSLGFTALSEQKTLNVRAGNRFGTNREKTGWNRLIGTWENRIGWSTGFLCFDLYF